MKPVIGWQDLTRYDFGQPLGKRWMSNCEIPDLDLLPQRYPQLKNVRFQAGLEVTVLHVGLWLLSGLTRINVIRNWSTYSNIITKLSEYFVWLGCDSGGMFVELKGVDENNKQKKISWQLVAEDGVGPNVPIISALLMIEKIEKKQIKAGAMPCMGLFDLNEFFNIAKNWGIYQRRVEHD